MYHHMLLDLALPDMEHVVTAFARLLAPTRLGAPEPPRALDGIIHDPARFTNLVPYRISATGSLLPYIVSTHFGVEELPKFGRLDELLIRVRPGRHQSKHVFREGQRQQLRQRGARDGREYQVTARLGYQRFDPIKTKMNSP